MHGKLTVLTGNQQGAVAGLPPGVMVVIGSSHDCDVVLRDPSIKFKQATIQSDNGTITLAAYADGCQVNDNSVAVGETVALSGSIVLKLGDVTIGVSQSSSSESIAPAKNNVTGAEQGGNVPNSGLAEPFSNMDNSAHLQADFLTPAADDLPTIQKNKSETVDAESQLDRGRLPSVLAGLALLLALGVVWQSGVFSSQPVEQPIDLSALISASSFAALTVEQTGTSAVVGGFVRSVQESNELEHWLDLTGLTITNEVVVGETLSEQVFDVFRVHGIPATVEVDSSANVDVNTAVAQPELLEGIKQRAEQDIPGLALLTITNVPPTVNDTADLLVVDSGKRVAMVVSDEPAFIVTEDKSRYFVGSLLPTGHKIADISNGVVFLLKNGVSTTLEF